MCALANTLIHANLDNFTTQACKILESNGLRRNVVYALFMRTRELLLLWRVYERVSGFILLILGSLVSCYCFIIPIRER